jgi:hypothetical protein
MCVQRTFAQQQCIAEPVLGGGSRLVAGHSLGFNGLGPQGKVRFELGGNLAFPLVAWNPGPENAQPSHVRIPAPWPPLR